MKKEFPFTIGADPEFTVCLNESEIDASRLINSVMNNKHEKGEDGYIVKKDDKVCGGIGWDGHAATAEIRPMQDKRPEKLTENMKHIITTFLRKTKIFETTTISKYSPIGGHIHIGIKPEGFEERKISKDLYAFYIPIIAGEESANLNMRLKGGYGKMNDVRVERRGSAYTMELRCPSAEWLTSEKLTLSTFAYFATIYQEITKNPENFKKMTKEIAIATDKQADALQNLAIVKYSSITTTIINKLKKAIKTFEYYEEYKEEIDYIMNPQKVAKDKKAFNYDLMNGWGISKENKIPNLKMLLNEKALDISAKKDQTSDIDNFSQLINIKINEDDHGLGIAREAISKRIVILNWKLKHKYILFGVRKGKNGYIIFNHNNELLLKKDTDILKAYNFVKTNNDYSRLTNIYQNILGKFYGRSGNAKIDRKIISIGIPYNDRIDKNHKELIKIINSIEKGLYIKAKFRDLECAINNKNNKEGTEMEKDCLNKSYLNKNDNNAISPTRGINQEYLELENQENVFTDNNDNDDNDNDDDEERNPDNYDENGDYIG